MYPTTKTQQSFWSETEITGYVVVLIPNLTNNLFLKRWNHSLESLIDSYNFNDKFDAFPFVKLHCLS